MKKRNIKIHKDKEIEIIKLPNGYLTKKFEEIKPLLIEIQCIKKEDEDLQKALIEYVIIKTVTIFEVFFKALAFKVGSSLGENLDNILKGNLEDGGNALAQSFNHANPNLVKNIYSELVGIDIMKESMNYFDNFNNEGIEHEKYHIRHIPLLRNNWNNFERIFIYRNKIVHENFSPIIKYSELRKMIGSVFDVMGGTVHSGSWDILCTAK